jgi:SAM-dependent methyltransferase
MRLRYFASNILDRWRKRNSMIPPKSMDFVGGSAFEEVGQEFKGYLISLAELQPRDRVLDVGCGIGRIAIPLTDYLSPEGEYWGFDIVKDGIDWCNSRIAPRSRIFTFCIATFTTIRIIRAAGFEPKTFVFPLTTASLTVSS